MAQPVTWVPGLESTVAFCHSHSAVNGYPVLMLTTGTREVPV